MVSKGGRLQRFLKIGSQLLESLVGENCHDSVRLKCLSRIRSRSCALVPDRTGDALCAYGIGASLARLGTVLSVTCGIGWSGRSIQ